MHPQKHSSLRLSERAPWVLSAVLASCAVLLVGSHLYAQAVSGTILGTVTDPGGAAVANAQVTIVLTGQQTTYDAVTNDSGNFTEPNLPSGTYTVTVAAPGFKK